MAREADGLTRASHCRTTFADYGIPSQSTASGCTTATASASLAGAAWRAPTRHWVIESRIAARFCLDANSMAPWSGGSAPQAGSSSVLRANDYYSADGLITTVHEQDGSC